jgi:hypothetical protein
VRAHGWFYLRLGAGAGGRLVVPAEIDWQVPADLENGAGFG